jgi:uncharacterized protein (UPF0332 family)
MATHGAMLRLVPIMRFNKEFVHSGLFPAEFTTVLTRLYEDRQSGDYDFVAGVSEAEARQDVLDAQRIVEAIQRFLSSP